MIKKLELENFKKFKNSKVELRVKSLSIVVGGNNSGKSSLLQALALWNYAKSVIVFFKGRAALNQNSKKDGVGISFDDFTPINIPSFEYLWTNLSAVGSYTLKLKVFWDGPDASEKFLQISFSLVQDRLYAKNTDSNLSSDEYIPEVAYLPPFAGITEKEAWLSIADRRKQIGRGLSGSVLRNLVYDYYEIYAEQMNGVKSVAKKNQANERRRIWMSSLFGQLNDVLAEVFSVQLFPEEFSKEFHNYLKVPIKKGVWQNNEFKPHNSYAARDIMAEGRGFLQWLSTFCLLFDKRVDVLLLDEPDAHLHATLQVELVKQLEKHISVHHKQILIATHSSEVIKFVPHSVIIEVDSSSSSYCSSESQVRKILLGIGIDHFPLLHKVQQNKKVVFVENSFDEEILKSFAEKRQTPIPSTVVFWPMANNHKERKQVYLHLKDQIPGITVMSIEDKDHADYATTRSDLSDSGSPDLTQQTDGITSKFLARRWRRWELENYLINPRALAAISGVTEDTIKDALKNEFSLVWPSDHVSSERSNTNAPLFDRDGKTMVEWFEEKYKFLKHSIPKHFEIEDIPQDLCTIIDQIRSI